MNKQSFVLLGLVVLTFAVFGQVSRFEFLNYDDPPHVYENNHVQRGLSWESVRWAFTTGHFATWMPLTWLSYMVDYELYELNAGGYHVTNVMFHTFNVALLFLILHAMTGRLWTSAFVAAVFAVHPLHVAPVVWISSRKDVLSAFFWMCALLAYSDYAKRPRAAGLMLVTVFYACGLMAKSMVITLPFALLLLDYWPLGRFAANRGRGFGVLRAWRPLVVEKLPLFVLAPVSVIITVVTAESGGALSPISTTARLTRPFVHYLQYLGYTFWPVDLFTPHLEMPVVPPWPMLAGSVLILAAVTFLAARTVSHAPYFLIGWLWFLGTLLPVIGFAPLGSQSIADRYMYLPLIGLAIIVAWGVPDLLQLRGRRAVQMTAGLACIAILAGLAIVQTARWKNSQTFFEYVLRIQPENVVANSSLGETLMNDPETRDEAREYLRRALEILPSHVPARVNLAVLEMERGNYNEAIRHNREILEVEPDHLDAHNNLGNIFLTLEDPEEAIKHYRVVLEHDPDHTAARLNLGAALLVKGDYEQAEQELRRVIERNPPDAMALTNLAAALYYRGRIEEAIAYVDQAIQTDPDYAQAHELRSILLEESSPTQVDGEDE